MSSEVDNHHREMSYHRHHTAPGSAAQHQWTREQHDLHAHLSRTSAETHDEHSRMSSIHELITKVWSQVRQCLLLAVAVLFMMWQHFKAFTSLWSSISFQGHSRNTRNLSVNAEVDTLSYCSKKWKREALNAKQIRRAYEDLYWKHNIKTLQPVKEDNYCLLRAVMFQVFSQTIPFPGWMKEKDIIKLPEKLLYSQGCNWIQQFSFGTEKYAGPKVYGKLRSCLELFKNEWVDFYASKDRVERNKMIRSFFSDETKEYKIYEALKFIMLYLVIEAHENLKTEEQIPSFFHFLFSQDTSADPLSYMMNHLNMVGDTIGLEQAELCLVGYALEVKIKLLRLTKFNKEDFEMVYPADHKRNWHEITLMTDDDRHFNIPVIAK
ncbi:inactive ubiquitin thioesterase OTULINL isoform X1 [Bufo gargarizans]|uniref:inactive ubiquitin thioesterase OTULINL isoform X1 n=1 Tax=Bufo gargarizans TaxID=30331 RepID=UPI001CF54091|nr:inactive ubiquitin thioesterase OTULINL isoform X1 [Bufo gargarizans]